MSEDFLSQDEIDALLGDSYPPIEDDVVFEEADTYTLAEAIRVCVENAFEEASSRLTEMVAIEFQDVDLKGLRPTEGDEAEWVAAELDFSGDLQGIFVFLAHPDWVRSVSEALDQAVDDKDMTDDLGRFAAFLDPMAAALQEQLATLLRLDLQAQVVAPHRVDLSADSAALPFGQSERVITFDLLMQVGDDSGNFPGRLLLPNEVAETLMERLTTMNGVESEEPESAFVPDEPIGSAETESAATAVYQEPPPVAPMAESVASPRGDVRKAEFANLGDSGVQSGSEKIDLLLDVPLKITVELGRAEMEIRDILSLAKGQVIELDKLAGEPVDVFVNGKLIAKGEVVVMDENFGVKISTIVSRHERMQNLQ